MTKNVKETIGDDGELSRKHVIRKIIFIVLIVGFTFMVIAYLVAHISMINAEKP